MNQTDRDPGDMFRSIFEFPEQMRKAMAIGESISLAPPERKIRNIVLAGMGGSAIGGDVVRVLIKDSLSVPFVVSRHYQIPNWVNEKSLVICSSYSGNTEETLSACESAIEKGALVYGISTGGRLTERLVRTGRDVIAIPGGLQPRAALAFSFIPLLYLLKDVNVLKTDPGGDLISTIPLLEEVRDTYALEKESNPTYSLARRIYRTLPIVYGESEDTAVIALRWKGQFCENAKMLAYHNELPELDHNEIVGWENNPDLLRTRTVLWLADPGNHEKVILRQEITKTIIQDIEVPQEVVSVAGNGRFQRLVHLIHYGDWVSYWCALAHGSDPTPVKKIDLLKSKLSELTR